MIPATPEVSIIKPLKIYFAGELRSPFIKQDLELVKEIGEVTLFDFTYNSFSLKNAIHYLISAFKEWKKIYRSDCVIIWFADYPEIPFFIWAKLFRKPCVIHVGGWEVSGAGEIMYGNQLNPTRGWITRTLLTNCTKCIVMSKAYKSIVKNIVPSAKVRVIPGWVDLASNIPEEKSGVVTAYWGLESTINLKGIPIFIEATKGMQSEILSKLSHEELMERFKRAKVYCQLSYTESFGMSLLEAMSYGCVPVVTNRDALPEVVGDCGEIVPYGDVKATTAAIMRAMKRDPEKAINRARVFSRDRAKYALKNLLEEICQRH